ncbi:plasmid replication protein, CyRepA1 family [Pseudomonas caspiana]
MNAVIHTVLINATNVAYATPGDCNLAIPESSSVSDIASALKSAYPQIKRFISINKGVSEAIDAAYRTASGIYSTQDGEIASSIYDLSKVDVALLIAEFGDDEADFDRAAFEIARESHTSGRVQERAHALARVSSRNETQCLCAINEKLIRITARMDKHAAKLKIPGTAPASAAAVAHNILANGGAYLLSLPTGYGKTSEIIEPVIREYLAHGKKVLIVSHRRSINRNIARHIPGIASYDECITPDILASAKGLKIVVNSLGNDKYLDWLADVDLVILDEASQIISHVHSGDVKDRETVFRRLEYVVRRAQDVILSDADINQHCQDLIHRNAPVTLYKLEQDHSTIAVSTGSIDHVAALAVAAAVSGETTLIAADTVKDCEALAKRIEKQTGTAPLVITSDSAKWHAQAAFIANPNTRDHRVVIYSPVITSALSITSGHFKNHFGLFSGQIVPGDCVQMLRRNRTAKLFTVGLKNPEYSKSGALAVEFKKPAMARTAAVIAQATTLPEATRQAVLHAIEMDFAPSAYQSLRQSFCVSEAWLKDNIQNTLPATLLQQGFQVSVLKQDDETTKTGRTHRREGRKAAKRSNASKLFAAKKASPALVKAVRNEGSANELEHFAVIRERAQVVLERSPLTQADTLFWGLGEGEGKVRRFRALWSVEPLVQVNGVVVSKETVQAHERLVYEVLLPALSGMLLTKTWRSEDSALMFDRLNEIRELVVAVGIPMGKARSTQAKQAAVTKVLAGLGLKTKKVDGGNIGDYYVIDPKSLEQMIGYL